ncbi:odorant receptor 10-like [Halyomorpha halys]|uniref:odorant receptor 10-like n=1 Tax=Halyomorpha halys TaxID=286706 RepID=UPI0006D4D64D|nr:Odorant receptor 32 [Halyomorpha halys]
MVYLQRLQKSDLFDGLNIGHLKFYGLWNGINDYRSTRKTSCIFKFNMTVSALYVFPFVVFQFICIFIISVDLKMATFVYMNGVSAAQVLFKIIVFWYRFKDQCDLVDLLRVDFLSSIPDSKTRHVNEIYKKNSLRCNIFTILAFTGNVLTIITWTILPGFNTEKTGTGRKKILSGWYPVTYSESPWYEIVFVYEVILICWHGSLVSLYESFLLMLLVGLYSHFVVLGYHLSTLKKNDKAVVKAGVDTKIDEAFNIELKKIMQDYNKLLRYSTLLRTTYNAITTVTLGLDIGVLILTIMFLMFGSSDGLSTFKMMMYFSFALIEITLLCVTSSIVGSASMSIHDSAYSSDWYVADKKFATTAQMIMIRSMIPVSLTALKMYPVNMETMIGIIRFIYSAVAIVSKMKE